MKRTYGWRKQPPDDGRDYKLMVAAPQKLPPLIDLESDLPPCYDQGQIGSCTANAIAAAIQFDEIKQKGITPSQSPVPSREFIYYTERDIEGTADSDNGACLRDGVKAVATLGFPPESIYPYDVDKVNVRPSELAYSIAAEHKIKIYKSVEQSSAQIRACLAQMLPVIFGFTVYSNIDDTETTGILGLPDTNKYAPEGGHAVLCVGYDDEKQMFKIRNSWGTQWANNGYFFMPYAYLLDPHLASDLWVINSI